MKPTAASSKRGVAGQVLRNMGVRAEECTYIAMPTAEATIDKRGGGPALGSHVDPQSRRIWGLLGSSPS